MQQERIWTHCALGSSMSSKGKVGLAGVVTPWQSTVGRRRSRSILKLGSAQVCVLIDWKEYFEHKNSCLCSVSGAPKTIFQYISPILNLSPSCLWSSQEAFRVLSFWQLFSHPRSLYSIICFTYQYFLTTPPCWEARFTCAEVGWVLGIGGG